MGIRLVVGVGSVLLAVAAWSAPPTQPAAGRPYAQPALRLRAKLHRTHHGSSAGEGLGAEVAAVGDIDGDGTSDYAALSRVYTPGSWSSDGAHLFSGATGNLLWKRTVPGPASRYFEIGPLEADADGDGTPDLYLGMPTRHPDTPNYDAGDPSSKLAVVSGADGHTLYEIAGPSGKSGSFGGTAVALGDVTGPGGSPDGRPDLAIGDTGFSSPSYPGVLGAVFVYSGTTFLCAFAEAGLPSWLDLGARYGLGLAAGNAPGLPRGILAVSAPYVHEGGPSTYYHGKLFVYDVVSGARRYGIEIGDGSATGRVLRPQPDMDGDGYGEFIASDYYTYTGFGRVVVVSGSAGSLVHVIENLTWQVSYFGIDVCGGPDLNGDGVADFLVSELGGGPFTAPSRILVYSGATAAPILAIPFPSDAEAARSACFIGDVDGNGKSDIAAGDPLYDGGPAGTDAGWVRIYKIR